MVLRFEHNCDWTKMKIRGKIEASEWFVEANKEMVIGQLTSFVFFNHNIWKEAIKGLTNLYPEMSTKLQQLLIAGVSTFIQQLRV